MPLARLLVVATILVAFSTDPADAADRATAGKWVSLFNGKDLTGWTVKITGHKSGDNFANTFRVENGVMKVSYDGYKKFNGRFGHIFYNEKLSHYRLRVEYRFTGKQCPGGPGWAYRNSGIMLHCESPQQMELKQNFPTSIECQLLGGRDTGNRPTANVCTPGTDMVMKGSLIRRHCTNSTSRTFRGDVWVTVEVEVHGGKTIKHIIDGKTVLEYKQPQLDDRDAHAKTLIPKSGNKLLTAGYISLQSESHPVEFRKIELMKLAE